jgi:hypothetical protein
VRGAVLSTKAARKMGADFILTDLHFERNSLYEPLSPSVQRLVHEHGIKVHIYIE